MNVKSDNFYVNGQTSSNSNLNSRWNFVIKVGCFEISFMCRTHSWYFHYFIFSCTIISAFQGKETSSAAMNLIFFAVQNYLHSEKKGSKCSMIFTIL